MQSHPEESPGDESAEARPAELDWCCIAAVNNEAVLAGNLAASPALARCPDRLLVLRDQPNAGIAYNRGLDQTRAEICVFAHQDVYLPEGWEDRLATGIQQAEAEDPDWAVLGVYGVRPCGNHAGRVWDTGLNREFHPPSATPVPVASLDELLIVLRRSSQLRFDESMPSFHLFGTDIVQQALEAGHGAYAIEAPVVHNSIVVVSLSGAFARSFHYVRRKWRHRLPIKTTVTKITPLGMKFRWRNLKKFRWPSEVNRIRAESEARTRRNPAEIAKTLGYE